VNNNVLIDALTLAHGTPDTGLSHTRAGWIHTERMAPDLGRATFTKCKVAGS